MKQSFVKERTFTEKRSVPLLRNSSYHYLISYIAVDLPTLYRREEPDTTPGTNIWVLLIASSLALLNNYFT